MHNVNVDNGATMSEEDEDFFWISDEGLLR